MMDTLKMRDTTTVDAASDFSLRTMLEEKLRVSEQRFQALVQGSIQGVLVARDMEILFANEECATILGYDSADEMQRAGSLADHLHPDGRARLQEYAKARLQGRPAPDTYDVRALRKDGTAVWLEVRVTMVEWDGSLAVQAVCYDITERKHAVDALRQARDELEVKVEERTRALREEIAERKAAQEQATRANQSKSEFLSSMSHELRTPLNAILGFAQLLRDYSDQPLSPEQESFLKQILGGGQHLLGLVNEVLDLSKIESGRFDFALETFDPTAAMRESLRLVQPLADERGISINAERGIAPGTLVKADPSRLKQVFLNVL